MLIALVVGALVVGLVAGYGLAVMRRGTANREAHPQAPMTDGGSKAAALASGSVDADSIGSTRPTDSDESPADLTDASQIQDLEGLQAALRVRIEELETELRRYRRWVNDHLADRAERLDRRWKRAGLPGRVHDLPDDVSPDVRRELADEAGPMRRWIDEFGLGTAEMHFQLGLFDALEGRLDQAAQGFQFAAHNGVRPEGWLALGDVQWELGRPKKAARAYEQCRSARKLPDHVSERFAEVALSERREREGLQVLEPILKRGGGSERTFELAVRLHCRLEEWQAAVDVCERGLKRHPESALLRARMICPLGRLEAHERVEGCAQRARKLAPEPVEVPIALGLERLQRGRLDEAEDLFREALELDPAAAEAHCQLGVIANRRGQFGAAIQSFRSAVELHPDYAEAYFHMKDAYEGLRDFNNAIAVLNRAVQLDPGYA